LYLVRSSSSFDFSKRRVESRSLVAPGDVEFEKRIVFPDLLEVVYDREEPEPEFRYFMAQPGQARGRSPEISYQISWIKMNGPSVVFNNSGVLSDPLALVTYGYWSYKRVAEWLPADYKPE